MMRTKGWKSTPMMKNQMLKGYANDENPRLEENSNDESHRLNECSTFRDTNQANKVTKSCFEHVHSDKNATLETIIAEINKVWEFCYANGRVKKTEN